jgi:hypothetical protein
MVVKSVDVEMTTSIREEKRLRIHMLELRWLGHGCGDFYAAFGG